MARAKITVVYDKKTGRHEILVDMDQEVIDLRRHNRAHDRLVRELAGPDADVQVDADPGAAPESRREEPPTAAPGGKTKIET